MLIYQRVNPIKSHWITIFLWFSYGFPMGFSTQWISPNLSLAQVPAPAARSPRVASWPPNTASANCLSGAGNRRASHGEFLPEEPREFNGFNPEPVGKWGNCKLIYDFQKIELNWVFFENFGLDSEFKLIDGFVVDWTKAKIGFHRGICRSWIGKLVDSPSKIYILPWRIVPIIGIWYDRQYLGVVENWKMIPNM